MTLRARLTLAFWLFAALPLAAALWPVSRTLSRSLQSEYAARLDGATRAVEGELARLGALAGAAARELARGPELDALARDEAQEKLDPAEVAPRAAGWMAARGLEVLAVADAGARVVSSGHLPGRAGDADPELSALFAAVPPGRAVPWLVSRAGSEGVEPVLALVAWEPVPDSPLRVAAGLALGPRFAERVAALTGGEVAVLREGEDRPLAASAGPEASGPGRTLARLLGTPQARARAIPIPGARGELGRIEVTLPAAGLERAQVTVSLAVLFALCLAAAAALLGGHLLARRITRPLEALREAAVRVAGGDLGARVEARASGEVGDLVRAFNAMTADLIRSRERATSAERVAAWREVARRLAHEVKNPLTPIAMSVETLREALERRRPDFEEIFREGTQAIQEEVRRLKRIVDEFSRFARLPPPQPAPVAAGELLSALLALYPSPPPGVRLEREVPEGLPPVSVDRDQMLQVLLNLVQNATEAMPRGGSLRLAARREGAEVLLSVSDTGPGIAPADVTRVFEPYFTTKEGGTGLGLAIAERIVSEHGGRIEVASRQGQGATFTVRLPVASAAPQTS
ncbi:MAG TPA: ATP-binding protein [Anaeromyxobacteraceae bacterium]|nr:ATP-binding protein [Anaeromyxobacteraceae bacterium]